MEKNVPTGGLFPAEQLRAWVTSLCEQIGMPPTDAATTADVLVAANLRGVDSHGVLQLPVKARRIMSRIVNPAPQLRLLRESPAALLVDGDNGMGMVVGVWAMDRTIERARQTGVAVALVRRSNHFGMAAYYVQRAAATGQIGLCLTNTGKAMAPWGSITPYFGTNPLAFAAPGGVVLDMATSQVAWGKVELAARAGRKIPTTWATDEHGQPTDDPVAAMRGLMLPLGGYKGYGLALMVEVLAAVLAGASFGAHVGDFYLEPDREENVGHCFIAIDIAHFMLLEEFIARMDQMAAEIRASQPAPGDERIRLPGEAAQETLVRRRRDGIPLPPDVVAELSQLGDETGVPFSLDSLAQWR